MDDQVVEVDQTENLKQNTFTKEDHKFIGWNTKANGTGTPYTDKQEIYNLVAAGESITLYAQWEEIPVAYLDAGETINLKMKRLANGPRFPSWHEEDVKVKQFKQSSSLPVGFIPSDANTISTLSSPNPVYIFFDDGQGIMYFYTDANKIYLNSNSDHLFVTFPSLFDVDVLSGFDTSKAVSMEGMLERTAIENIDFAKNWDTSKVTNMSYMLWRAGSITNIDGASDWDTSAVTTMEYMLNSTTSLTNIDGARNWNTSSVTDMYRMFYGASSLTNIDALSSWNTSSVTTMYQMFRGASSLTNIDGAIDWNTSSVTTMYQMFYGASSLTDINGAAKWTMSAVTTIQGMFNGTAIRDLNALSNWNTSSINTMTGAFYRVASLTDVSGARNWDTGNVTEIGYMFYGANNIDATVLNNWNVSEITNKFDAFTNPVAKRPCWYNNTPCPNSANNSVPSPSYSAPSYTPVPSTNTPDSTAPSSNNADNNVTNNYQKPQGELYQEAEVNYLLIILIILAVVALMISFILFILARRKKDQDE